MKTLFTLTLCTVVFAGLYLAGCDTTTISEGDLASSEQVGESLTAAKGAKIDICHKRADQGYLSINFAVNAEAAHRAHGDGQVFDDIPGMADYIFADDCVPVEACPCFTLSDLEEHVYTIFLGICNAGRNPTACYLLEGPWRD